MAEGATEELSGLRKAAVLTLMLGPEAAAQVVEKSGLEEAQVERLAAELARLEGVDEETRRSVGREFERTAAEGASSGGVAAAEDLLRRALGAEKAAEIIPWVRPRRSARPFGSLAQVETSHLIRMLDGEQPLAIAVVLRHLPRRKAGEIVSGLDENKRIDVVMNLVKGKEPLREAVRQMESALGRKVAAWRTEAMAAGEDEAETTAGPRLLTEILNNADLSGENAVLEALAERDPELGEQVRQSMFIFDDLPRLDGGALQMALREVEPSDLAMALKGAPDAISTVIFANLSENAAAGLKEDLESLGPVRKRDVYAAQEKVVMAVRALADEGKINIRPEEEEQDEMIE